MTAIVGAHETPYARHPAEDTDTASAALPLTFDSRG